MEVGHGPHPPVPAAATPGQLSMVNQGPASLSSHQAIGSDRTEVGQAGTSTFFTPPPPARTSTPSPETHLSPNLVGGLFALLSTHMGERKNRMGR